MSPAPIEITGEVVGAETVKARLLVHSGGVHDSVRSTVESLSIKLQNRIKDQKLSGQVLHVQTGRLRRSINRKITDTGETIEARVGTNVEYGKAWELGREALDIYPIKAKALRWFGPGGEAVFASHVHQPARAPRPFLRPALEEMRAEIRASLLRAAVGGV